MYHQGMATTVLDRLSDAYDDLSPQMRLAARYVIDNPAEIAVTSMRQLAESADVKPNTLVRMAQALGFDGYDEFREPFREAASRTSPSFPDRARWLRSISQGGRHGELLTHMAGAALRNVEALFHNLDADDLKAAADCILAASRTNVLGVGTARPLADNFCYVASMAMDNVVAIPANGRLAIDDVGRMNAGDVLVAMTFSPYRSEIVEAVRLAAARDVTIIAMSDSLTAPIAGPAAHVFAVPTDTPQFFSSVIAAGALLETMLAFMAADTSVDAANAIETFHDRRRTAGIYTE